MHACIYFYTHLYILKCEYTQAPSRALSSHFNAFKWYSLSRTDASVFDKLMPCTEYLSFVALNTNDKRFSSTIKRKRFLNNKNNSIIIFILIFYYYHSLLKYRKKKKIENTINSQTRKLYSINNNIQINLKIFFDS